MADAGDRERQIRRQRESFVALLHVYTITDGARSPIVSAARITADLGLSVREGEAVIDHLAAAGYLARVNPAGSVEITPQGIDYIERQTGRRRSVRAPTETPPSARPNDTT